jgi:hypothetical protein
MPPRRDFYYVPHVRYDPQPHRALGGHHRSPVPHERSSHRAVLTRVSVDADEQAELLARQYTIAATEDLPPDVLLRMQQRGKQPQPGTMNAFRWIEKSASRVNANRDDLPQPTRVTVIKPG